MNREWQRVCVGTDIQAIDEVARSIQAFGAQYLSRLFTDHEVETSGGAAVEAAPSLAARFAAKEATIKVLRPVGKAPRWTSIEVRRSPNGWTDIELHAEALGEAQRAGLHSFSLSLSHGAGFATATVVALQNVGDETWKR